jgi:hypothetical protein
MADIKGKVDLGRKFEMGPLWFSRAEWWDDHSRFVLVRYSLDGKEQPYGLRLDMDKAIFLDRLPDPELEKFAQYIKKDLRDFIVWLRVKSAA